MGMSWPPLENHRCAERGCPFPPAPGESLCQYHIQMFLFDESLTGNSIETDFSKEPEETPKHRVSIVSAAEVSLARWREKKEKTEQRSLFNVLRHKRLRHRRTAAGKCSRCGEVAQQGRMCSSCSAKFRLRRQNIRFHRLTSDVCTHCGHSKRHADGKICSHCLEKVRTKYHQRRAQGLCVTCARPTGSMGSRCANCILRRDGTKAAARWHSRYERLRAAGLCTKCKAPIEPERTGRSLCRMCAIKKVKGSKPHNPRTAAQTWKARYLQLLEAGRCTKCAVPIEIHRAGRTLCGECARKKLEMSRVRSTRVSAAIVSGSEAGMKTKNQRRYVVCLSCIDAHFRIRRALLARSSDAAYWKVQDDFFNAHPEILERGFSVGGSVSLAH